MYYNLEMDLACKYGVYALERGRSLLWEDITDCMRPKNPSVDFGLVSGFWGKIRFRFGIFYLLDAGILKMRV